MIARLCPYVAVAATILVAAALNSCATTNPNSGRALIGIAVTPPNADAQTYANGQVTFTATGTFSLPPITAPVTFTAPYSGSFAIDNPVSQTVATVVSSGTGTITVQCTGGATGGVEVVATASANNSTTTTVTGAAKLTCP